MNPFPSLISFIGRLCLSFIFVLSGAYKVLNWQGTIDGLTGALTQWVQLTPDLPWTHEIINALLPHLTLVLIIAVIFELLGGISVFLGINVRFGAFLLAIFLIPTTILFHHFWLLQGPDRSLQMAMFLKNLSIFGGLLVVLGIGKGKCAPQKKEEKPNIVVPPKPL